MKKTSLLSLWLAFSLLAVAAPETTLSQLKKVNSNWNSVPVFTPALLEKRLLTTERELVQTHLYFVIAYLQQAKHELTDHQVRARQLCIDKLVGYCSAGVFPKNTLHCTRQPYFIDEFDNYCAVGYLLKETGYDAVAKRISREMNYAYVREIPKAYIEEWANLYGFTIDELALIQPTYSPLLHCQSDTFFIGKNTPAICRLMQNDVISGVTCYNSVASPTLSVLDSTQSGSISIVQLPNDTLLVYTPNSGFEGVDSLMYEVVFGGLGMCFQRRDTAKAFFVVLPTPGTYVSFYPGDADYNGEITNKDFLLLAKNMGEQGAARTTIGGDCMMRFCQPWSSSFMESNAASADADGNGIINDADFDASVNCFITDDKYMVPTDFASLYKLIFEPYDTTLTPGDSIRLKFTVRHNNGSGNVVPLKAITTIMYSYNVAKLNPINTEPTLHALPLNTPFVKEKSYSKPVHNWGYPYCRYSGTLRTDGHPSQNPYTIITDTFAVIGKSIAIDSIYADGPVGLRFSETYALTSTDSVIYIQDGSIVFNVSRTITDVTENTSPVSFSLTPNPTSSFLTISVPEEHTGSTVTLTDLTGRVVLKSEIENHTSEINIASLPSGIYLAVLTTPNGQRAVRKVVKE